MNTAYLDTTRTLTNEDDPFTNEGTPVAVTATITVVKPDGTEADYTVATTPAVTTPATGVYEVTITLDQAGEWLYRFSGTVGGTTARDWTRLYVWPDPVAQGAEV
jgi:hypothetical protein